MIVDTTNEGEVRLIQSETRVIKTGLIDLAYAKRGATISFAAGTIWGISLCYLILEVI